MKLKKKIRLLEARLEKGAKKLVKLKRKLSAATAAGIGKRKKKSAARATTKTPKAAQKKKSRLTGKPQMKPAGAKRRSVAKKVKRKLNLSPERRAQLAAAMNARWAAKRAAAEPIAENNATDQDFTLQEVPRSA